MNMMIDNKNLWKSVPAGHLSPVDEYTHPGPTVGQPDADIHIINEIFKKSPPKTKYYLDIGGGETYRGYNNHIISNTKHLRELGWEGFAIDGNQVDEDKRIHGLHITLDNIIPFLESMKTPKEFDFLSIDIDGVDYWILKKILKHYQPRVFMCEINPGLPVDKGLAIPYSDNFANGKGAYYGMNIVAAEQLANSFGYHLLTRSRTSSNYYFSLPDTNLVFPEDTSKYYVVSETYAKIFMTYKPDHGKFWEIV